VNPLRSVQQFVVKVANLAEAEGRVAKYHIVNVLQATVLLVAAGTLVVVGVTALAAALFLGLNRVMPSWLALGIVALVPLMLGVAGAMVGKRIFRR
jgi:hypothetical protein